jgi:serine/threonine protein kinase
MSKSKTRKKINNYIIHLDEPLGSGAFATVYKAHDEQSNTLFAAKVIDRLKSILPSTQCKPTSIRPAL